MIDQWFQYLQVRFSFLYYGGLAAGMALSGVHLFLLSPDFAVFSFSFFGLLLFFIQARLIDDFLDLKQDKIAHPERFFEAEDLTATDIRRLLLMLQSGLGFYSLVMAIAFNVGGGIFYFLASAVLWLTYKQFYTYKKWFQDPAWHLLAFPLALIPLAFFTISFKSSIVIYTIKALGYVLMLVGAFVTHNCCRKLNPHDHPILMTYMQFYGYKKTFYLTLSAMLVTAIGAWLSDCSSIIWPMQFVLAITLLFPFYRSEMFHLPKVAGTVALFVSVWAVVMHWIFLS